METTQPTEPNMVEFVNQQRDRAMEAARRGTVAVGAGSDAVRQVAFVEAVESNLVLGTD